METSPMRPRRQDDRLRPTPWSIQRGSLVIPLNFVRRHEGLIDWNRFEVSVRGRRFADRRLDSQRRLAVQLRDIVADGEELVLTIRDGMLHLD